MRSRPAPIALLVLALSLAAAIFVAVAPAAAQSGDAVRPLSGIAVDETMDGPSLLFDALPAVPAAQTLPLIVRLAIDLRSVASSADARQAALDRLDARVQLYRARHIDIILALGAFPEGDAETDAWRAALRALMERERGRIAAVQIGSAIAGSLPPIDAYVFQTKLAAVQIRSVDSDVAVLCGPVPPTSAAWVDDLFARGAGPYVNGLAVGPDEDAGGGGEVSAIGASVAREVRGGFVVAGPLVLGDAARAAPRLVNAALRRLGSTVRVVAVSGAAPAIVAALTMATHVADLLSGDLVPLDERAAGLRLTRGADDVTATIPHELLYAVSGADTYLVYGPSPGGPVDLSVSVANAMAPTIRDPETGTTTALRVERGEHNALRLTLPATPSPKVLDFSFGQANEYSMTSEARQETLPRVEEIIARYQQVQAAQDAALESYIADARMEQHFHPSPADPAYNIVTENRMFADRAGVEWEELSFALNGAKWGADRPPFPLLQPEKVLSLPLDLRLNEDYRYRLDGVEEVNGRSAFVVRFDPVSSSSALYRGTVWIDRRSYVRLKVQAVETHLTGPVVSNDETQVFAQAGDIAGRPIWLFDRLDSRQVFLIAGRTVLVERQVQLSGFRLNPSDFDAERTAARRSDRIMYRDTDEGLRYLVKKGDTRVVSNQLTQSARAFALGADVDPSLDYPLPIGGLDILDFNFLNRDMQFALLYGGVIALGNIQKPNLWGGRFDASVDFFGLAVKSNDSIFNGSGELRDERVTRIPASAGVNLGYQATPFQKLTGHYELRYDAYFRDAGTAPSFVVPSNGFTHGEGAGYEYRRRGYSLTANATAYQRSTWTPWGEPGAFDASARTYARYDAGVSKDFVFRTFHTVHLNGTYFGGRRLDRFSAYQFGIFDATRMHGVPSAVRFGDLAMFRGSYSFNLFDQYRLDLFFDHATGRDPQGDGPWRQVTGLGVGVTFRGPRSTLVRADLGKSLLPAVYRGAGSTVLQILILKPLG